MGWQPLFILKVPGVDFKILGLKALVLEKFWKIVFNYTNSKNEQKLLKFPCRKKWNNTTKFFNLLIFRDLRVKQFFIEAITDTMRFILASLRLKYTCLINSSAWKSHRDKICKNIRNNIEINWQSWQKFLFFVPLLLHNM